MNDRDDSSVGETVIKKEGEKTRIAVDVMFFNVGIDISINFEVIKFLKLVFRWSMEIEQQKLSRINQATTYQ